jgi:hypothetical protein
LKIEEWRMKNGEWRLEVRGWRLEKWNDGRMVVWGTGYWMRDTG